MRKTITLFAAVAFFGGGLLTATEKLPRYVDAETTADWIEKEAKQGDPEKQHILGFLYESGQFGKIQNDKKSFEWYMKGAKQGYVESYTSVARMYYRGIGVEKNKIEALAWFLVSKAEGDGRVVSIVDKMRNILEESEVEQAQARAEELQKEIKENKKKIKSPKNNERRIQK